MCFEISISFLPCLFLAFSVIINPWLLQKCTYVKFLLLHPPITETFRFCLQVYLYSMFQPSTESSSGIDGKNVD